MSIISTSSERILAAAESFLAGKGIEILETGYRAPGVDGRMAIIAMDTEEQTLIFCDLSSSCQEDGDGFAGPTLARWEAELLAGSYLSQHGDEVEGGTAIRFDHVSILVTRTCGERARQGILRWHKAAFSEA